MSQMDLLPALFDDRFLTEHVGKNILGNSQVALIELIANAWDANASEVYVSWPRNEGEVFSIRDNGVGLTEEEFKQRWMTLSYDRLFHQGEDAEIPARLLNAESVKPRKVFGRNGKGRHGAFCMSPQGYIVDSFKEGRHVQYKVTRPKQASITPVHYQKTVDEPWSAELSGTTITGIESVQQALSVQDIKSIVGMRFLSDPDFTVYINDSMVQFKDLPETNYETFHVKVHDTYRVEIIKIDVQEADKTTRQHGIAWQVANRLVGNIDWSGLSERRLLDGRSNAAKRFSFIVRADHLKGFVEADWTGFNDGEQLVRDTKQVVHDKIEAILFNESKEQRSEVFATIVQENEERIQALTEIERQHWKTSIKTIQESCPSLSQNDIRNVAILLAKMEVAHSKFGLLDKLSRCSSEDMDSLDQILTDWTVETARLVLNELQTRLKLIAELERKVFEPETDEVHDLQPLFEKGLWIFGPSYEAVGFTSNKGMTTVINELFHGVSGRGSKNRPDYCITPNSSIGFYAYPTFDAGEGEESGVGELAIVELKKPSIPLGHDELNQCEKYIDELLDKGLIYPNTPVKVYVLGRTAQRHRSEPRKRGDHIVIHPMTYDVILSKAKRRTHLLYEKIKANTPFLAEPELELETRQEVMNLIAGGTL